MLGQKGSLPVLERVTLPSLYDRRLQDIVVLMYKVKYGLVIMFPTYSFVRILRKKKDLR